VRAMVVQAVANARSVGAVVVDDIVATVDDVADIPAAVTDIPASSTVDLACVGVSVSVRVHGVGVCHAVATMPLIGHHALQEVSIPSLELIHVDSLMGLVLLLIF
jgi:hypothetical protein